MKVDPLKPLRRASVRDELLQQSVSRSLSVLLKTWFQWKTSSTNPPFFNDNSSRKFHRFLFCQIGSVAQSFFNILCFYVRIGFKNRFLGFPRGQESKQS